ncbi:MAG: acetoacetate decarboxylase family protein [Eubacteriaceae bacterium]|jgi:acetoacetate decarboxylase|nr:acetoacetate decarboxylase family protein [Eubacteriaceae bacterium]
MKPSIITPKEQFETLLDSAAMNNQYGIQVMCSGEPEKLQALLPPPLTVAGSGMVYIYVVNIREPTFAPWYMEGGIGILAEYQGRTAVYFNGLMLEGPGAFMGMATGRESNGLPKKLADAIHVSRIGDTGHCTIDRGGTRLLDVRLTLGQYNDPSMKTFAGEKEAATRENPIVDEGGGCFNFTFDFNDGFKNMKMLFYDSPTRFSSYEPATATVTLNSSLDDPWGDIPITGVIGAAWMVSDNWVNRVTAIHTYPDSEARVLMSYLFTGRYDQCILYRDHQRY